MSIEFCAAWPGDAASAFQSACFIAAALEAPAALLLAASVVWLNVRGSREQQEEGEGRLVPRSLGVASLLLTAASLALLWPPLVLLQGGVSGAALLRSCATSAALLLLARASWSQARGAWTHWRLEMLLIALLSLVLGAEGLLLVPLLLAPLVSPAALALQACLLASLLGLVLLRALLSRALQRLPLAPASYALLRDGEPPSEASPSQGASLKTLRLVLPFFWPSGRWGLRARLVLCILMMIGGKVLNVFVPLFYKDVINALSPSDVPNVPLSLPVALILIYAGSGIVTRLLSDAQVTLFLTVSKFATRSIVVKVFGHINALSLQWHVNRKTGAVLRTVDRGANATTTMLQMLLFTIVPTFIELIMTVISLSVLFGVVYALISFSVVGIYVWVTFTITDWRKQFRRKVNVADNAATQVATDVLLNYGTVKSFCSEEYETQRYGDAMTTYLDATIINRASLLVLNGLQWVVRAVGTASLLLLAGSEIVAGRANVGDLVAVISYLLQLYTPLGYLGSSWNALQNAVTDMEQVFALLENNSVIPEEEDAPELLLHGGEVVFDHVSFSYGDRQVLRDISFRVAPGSSLALVGPSGGGKTSLLRLLSRLYDPDSGTILVDGQDIRRVSKRSLRSAIGVVAQDIVLFNNTIGHNIAYGLLGQGVQPSQKEIEHAAQRASIHDFIMRNPDGYDTMVGERGLKLSGGEKQRVGIARVLLQNPAIAVCDEATSAMDAKTEREIQKQLDDLAEGRTTLTIAHRLSTVVNSDLILVLKGGRIAERGTHAELMAQQGEYFGLWAAQQEAEREAREKGERKAREQERSE